MSIQEAAMRKILIAAHRGIAGGNIPCNSYPAFEGALRQGADIIELDVSRSSDGVLYVFHPGMEPVFLGIQPLLSELPSQEIDKLRLRNQDHVVTEYSIPRLRDTLEQLKGRCYINLDKFWSCPGDISALVRELGMQDQVIIKTGVSKENFDRVEELAPDLPYMAIVRENDDATEELLRRKVRYIGVEALFTTEDAPVCQPEYLQSLRDCKLVAWANSIVYNYKAVLTAGHTDDVALGWDPDKGWGWLADRGFSIIQTDWPLMLRQYLAQR